MSTLMRGRSDLAGWFSRMDRAFEDWMRMLPMRRPLAFEWDWTGEELIRVDEYHEDGFVVIRAELPGIDPDRDVELTVTDGLLRIKAERRIEEKTEDKGYHRHELRYGSFVRALPLPDGAVETDIAASYKDGILEIRVPVPERPAETEPKKIAITKR